jgi:hypothetical protein
MGRLKLNATWAEVGGRSRADGAGRVRLRLGNWTMASILLHNLAVPVEEGVMVWPPDGKRP